AERQHRQPALRRGGEHAIDVLQSQAAVVECTLHALRHQVDHREPVGHVTKVGFGDPNDRGAGALEDPHHTSSAGTNTGQGGSSPPGRCTRKRTRWPIFTCIGSMSSTRLISRKPSSQSMSATLKGAPWVGCTTVVACTVPLPLLTRHSKLALPVNGQSRRG